MAEKDITRLKKVLRKAVGMLHKGNNGRQPKLVLFLIGNSMNEENQMRYTKLRQLQSLNLDSKISLAKQRIRQFAEEMDGNVIVSFSG